MVAVLHTRLALHKGVSVWNKWVNTILHQGPGPLLSDVLPHDNSWKLQITSRCFWSFVWEESCPASAAHANSGECCKDFIKDCWHLLQKSYPIVSVCGVLKPNLYHIFPHYRQKDTRERTHAFTYIILILHKACAGGHWYKLLQWATVSL